MSSWLLQFLENLMLLMVIGGGLFLLVQSKGLPFKYFVTSFKQLRSQTQSKDGITSFQALTAVIASTVGLGNISGVAIAIYMGGPGVIFWMWLTAILGMVIKFYSCSLAVLFRQPTNHKLVNGPMAYMTLGIPKNGKYLAILFSLATLVGVLPAFTANQITQAITTVGSHFLIDDNLFYVNLTIGLLLCFVTTLVIFGGLKKIVTITSKLVPLMVFIYVLMALFLVVSNPLASLEAFKTIFAEAFNFKTGLAGSFVGLIIIGMRRAVFSSESGLGTAPMYHGESQETNPIKEGSVAMLGPFIDTIVICTITALVIIVSGAYQQNQLNGIVLTLQSFEVLLGSFARPLLLVLVLIFGLSTLFTYAFYGLKASKFLFGAKYQHIYYVPYLLSIIFAAIASLDLVINLIDFAFAIMSIINMTAVLILSRHLKKILYDNT